MVAAKRKTEKLERGSTMEQPMSTQTPPDLPWHSLVSRPWAAVPGGEAAAPQILVFRSWHYPPLWAASDAQPSGPTSPLQLRVSSTPEEEIREKPFRSIMAPHKLFVHRGVPEGRSTRSEQTRGGIHLPSGNSAKGSVLLILTRSCGIQVENKQTNKKKDLGRKSGQCQDGW